MLPELLSRSGARRVLETHHVESVEIAIVGAGVAGAAAAWRLAGRGREVAVLEQFEVGHDRGSSHGPTRIFRFAYDHPGYVRMSQLALPLWRELESVSGQSLLEITGGLDAGTAEQIDRIAAALKANDAEFDVLDPGSRARRFPQFELENEFGLYSPDSGVLSAGKSVVALVDSARAAGADIRESITVSKVVPNQEGVRLETSVGPLSADRCVLAAGAWTGPILRPIGIDIPLQVSCEQVFYFSGENLPVFIHRNGISYYVVPKFGDAPGVKVGEHATGRRTTAEARGFDIDRAGEGRVVDFVRRRLPGLDPEPVAAETCLYTLTPDEDFVIDKWGPLVVASPCSGHGFKFGPLLGEIIAAMVAAEEPPVDIDRFSIDRFFRMKQLG